MYTDVGAQRHQWGETKLGVTSMITSLQPCHGLLPEVRQCVPSGGSAAVALHSTTGVEEKEPATWIGEDHFFKVPQGFVDVSQAKKLAVTWSRFNLSGSVSPTRAFHRLSSVASSATSLCLSALEVAV